MELPPNALKRAFREGRPQIGLWSQLTSPVAAEVPSRSGFDFLVIDTEHAPNELPHVLAQLQAMAGGTASPVVRVVAATRYPPHGMRGVAVATRAGGDGRVAGILAPVEADARHHLDMGCLRVAVGSDVGLLRRQGEALAARFSLR